MTPEVSALVDRVAFLWCYLLVVAVVGWLGWPLNWPELLGTAATFSILNLLSTAKRARRKKERGTT